MRETPIVSKIKREEALGILTIKQHREVIRLQRKALDIQSRILNIHTYSDSDIEEMLDDGWNKTEIICK